MPGNSVGMGFLIYNYLNTEEAIGFFCIYLYLSGIYHLQR